MPALYEISTDTSRFDIPLVHEFLRQSYWARNIPLEVVERSIRHALCFGAFHEGNQVGFARAVTDRATFVYVADVFVAPPHRGRGVSKQLMRAILEHPELQGVRRFLLATKDAHGLYQQFGFKPVPNPQDFMTLHFPDIYKS